MYFLYKINKHAVLFVSQLEEKYVIIALGIHCCSEMMKKNY